MRFPPGETANLFRGQFGKVLYRSLPTIYNRFFAPTQDSGPSGLHDPPRPFAFRVRHLDGAVLDQFHIGLNVFETNQPWHLGAGHAFAQALIALAHESLRAEFTKVEGSQPLHLPLTSDLPASRVRVHFLTPTELKPVVPPEFGILFARIRDRISTLRTLYGAGPLEIDFRAMGERARLIAMTRCDLIHVDAERVSRNTCQRHTLSGFTGVAEYEGDLTEFIPYLQIAAYTGVGRQTVWGKGEIRIETF